MVHDFHCMRLHEKVGAEVDVDLEINSAIVKFIHDCNVAF